MNASKSQRKSSPRTAPGGKRLAALAACGMLLLSGCGADLTMSPMPISTPPVAADATLLENIDSLLQDGMYFQQAQLGSDQAQLGDDPQALADVASHYENLAGQIDAMSSQSPDLGSYDAPIQAAEQQDSAISSQDPYAVSTLVDVVTAYESAFSSVDSAIAQYHGYSSAGDHRAVYGVGGGD